jgi:hypothetical protein
MKKTYFGIEIFENYYVKEADIKELPFYDFFNDSMLGSAFPIIDGEVYIHLHDWESFCELFIKTGKHRYSK